MTTIANRRSRRMAALALVAAQALAAASVSAHDASPPDAAAPETAGSDAGSHGKLLADGHAPAGVQYDHMHAAGGFMIGYRYNWSRTDGDIRRGTRAVNDDTITHNACLARGQSPTDHANHNHCSMKQSGMTMHMHMLDLMYAPTDWLTLMVMPQWMSMDMGMAALSTSSSSSGHGGHGDHDEHSHSGSHGHKTSGFGDTQFGALVRLFDDGHHHVHLGLMVSAPTGSTDKRDSSGALTHYMMQIGSGTWDALPSLTYTGRSGNWSWGAQVLGTVRLEEENDQGYRLGNAVQATAWGAYRLTDWLSASARLAYTVQGTIKGHYNDTHNHSSPPDLQGNYGGRFWDLGLGVNIVVPDGLLAGHRLGVEWIQPLRDDVNGYQEERTGTLYVNWSKAF